MEASWQEKASLCAERAKQQGLAPPTMPQSLTMGFGDCVGRRERLGREDVPSSTQGSLRCIQRHHLLPGLWQLPTNRLPPAHLASHPPSKLLPEGSS